MEWPGAPQLCQHGGEDLLSIVVPRHGSRGRPMRGCALMDPLGAQAIRQPMIISGCCGEDVMGMFSSYVSHFNCFFTWTCEFNSLLHA
jgi:hypothetical protein